jgi:hypothetical protein
MSKKLKIVSVCFVSVVCFSFYFSFKVLQVLKELDEPI